MHATEHASHVQSGEPFTARYRVVSQLVHAAEYIVNQLDACYRVSQLDESWEAYKII